MVFEVLFWVAVLGVIYPYAGYPLVLSLLGRFMGRPVAAGDGDRLPSVSMIIPVHNEAARLQRKIENTIYVVS